MGNACNVAAAVTSVGVDASVGGASVTDASATDGLLLLPLAVAGSVCADVLLLSLIHI